MSTNVNSYLNIKSSLTSKPPQKQKRCHHRCASTRRHNHRETSSKNTSLQGTSTAATNHRNDAKNDTNNVAQQASPTTTPHHTTRSKNHVFTPNFSSLRSKSLITIQIVVSSSFDRRHLLNEKLSINSMKINWTRTSATTFTTSVWYEKPLTCANRTTHLDAAKPKKPIFQK